MARETDTQIERRGDRKRSRAAKLETQRRREVRSIKYASVTR